jgi:type VI secretion system protein ImpM
MSGAYGTDAPSVQPPAGWYGKLPSTGDFASRRLSHELIEAWDGWLAQEIGELRQQYPDEWLQAYLESPTWRFVLGAGLLGDWQSQPLAGVLMPSVDRVGRYFPLTIVAPLPGLPCDGVQAESLLGWLHALDDLAADALQDDWPIDDLEQALNQLLPPQWPALPAGVGSSLAQLASGESRMVALPLPDTRSAMANSLGQALWGWGLQMPPHGTLGRQMAPGLAWWWSEPLSLQPDAPTRQTLLSRGLPSGHDFCVLLGSGGHTGMASAPPSTHLGDTSPSTLPGA